MFEVATAVTYLEIAAYLFLTGLLCVLVYFIGKFNGQDVGFVKGKEAGYQAGKDEGLEIGDAKVLVNSREAYEEGKDYGYKHAMEEVKSAKELQDQIKHMPTPKGSNGKFIKKPVIPDIVKDF